MISNIDISSFSHTVKKTYLQRYATPDNELTHIYCKEEGAALLEKLRKAQGTSSFSFKKKQLVRNLNNAGIDCSMSDDVEKLAQDIELLPESEELDRRLFRILFDIYNNSVSPSEQIELLVRKLGNDEFQAGSVRLAIVKQFILNTEYHTKAVKELIRSQSQLSADASAYEIALAADEDIFNVLETKMSKDDKKKYALLRLADDLQRGRFKSNGNTKTALYMFAFAFDMTAFIDPDTDIYDPDKDIEVNLFHKYYCNSIIRFISEDYNNNPTVYEMSPLGDGINYKNFAEVIYLYYLSKNDMPTYKRLQCAEKKIDDCVRFVESGNAAVEQASLLKLEKENRYTYIYKDVYIYILKKLKEEELVDFVCRNYQISTLQSSQSRIMISADTNTSAFYFKRNNAKKNKWVIEDNVEEKEEIIRCLPGEEKFRDLIGKMYDILYMPFSKTEDVVSRTDLLKQFYFQAIDEIELEGTSLYDLYTNMRTRCDRVLESSRYQSISDTNIFDMFILVMLYRRLNII